MGFFSEIFHGKRAQDLENQGRCDEAIEHVLKGGGHPWMKFEHAARILKSAKRYREAIDYYKKAADSGRVSSVFLNIMQCYEALGDYSGAMDFQYKAPPPYSNYDVIYETYKKYRALDPSFRLARSRLKDLFLDICRRECGFLTGEDPRIVVDCIREEGLTQEIIEALKAEGKSYWHVKEIFGEDATSRTFGDEVLQRYRALVSAQEGKYWEAARLYEAIGDFSEAAEYYKFSLDDRLGSLAIVPAVRCFAKAGLNKELTDFLKKARERYWFRGLDEDLIRLMVQEHLPGEAIEIIFDFSGSGKIEPKDAKKLVEFWEHMGRYDNAANVMQRAGLWVEAIWTLLRGSHSRDAAAILEHLRSGNVQQNHDSPWWPEVDDIERFNEQLLREGRLEEAAIQTEALAIWYMQANMPARAAKIYDLMGESGKSGKAQSEGSKQKPQDAARPKSESAEELKGEDFDQLVCPQCGAEVDANWVICPECEADLKAETCRNCGQTLKPQWKRCPACRTSATASDSSSGWVCG